MPRAMLLLTEVTGLVFVLTGMLSAGLGVTLRELSTQLARRRLVLTALGMNFIAAPLVAWGLCRALPLQPEHAAGLLLVGVAAGAPFLPKLAEMSRGSVPLAISLMVLLVLGSVGVLPFALRLLLPGSEIPLPRVVAPLLLLIAMPLGAGGTLRRWRPAWAGRAEPLLRRIGTASLALFVVMVIGTNLRSLLGTVGSFAILAAVLFTGLLGFAAYGLAGPEPDARPVLVLGTAQRNVAIALVVAGASFARQPGVRVMVLVVTVVSMIIVLLAASQFRRVAGKRDAGIPAAGAPAGGAA